MAGDPDDPAGGGYGRSMPKTRAGGLELDLEANASLGDDEEIWFEAEALERASTIELDASGHRLLRPAFDDDLLEPRAGEAWLRASTLPGPPGAGPLGYGFGPRFDHLLGGLGAGRTVWWQAEGPSAAVRHLFGQLAEGMALASAAVGTGPLSPALVLTSSTRRDAQLWALSRWTGFAQRIYRLGREGARALTADAEADVDGAFAAARVSLEGRLGRLREHLRYVDPDVGLRGGELVAHVTDAVQAWRNELSQAHDRDVVPVVVVEDLERWVGRRRDGRVRGDGAAALWSALLARAHAHRWSLAVHANSGPAPGSRPLAASVALALADVDGEPDERSSGAAITTRRCVMVLKRRDVAAAPARNHAVALWWDPETGRLGPVESTPEGAGLRAEGLEATTKP